ncbi:hypothetical protein R3P38DRAFT_3463669 [Favolaschia claudopus]|uniref:Uncharacterized protein n=1 Tax=Favolaschia claudopus TaxID=2862362 RepID=A0AAV9ZHK5_9AGAR
MIFCPLPRTMFFIYLGTCLPSPHPPMFLPACVRHSYAFGGPSSSPRSTAIPGVSSVSVRCTHACRRSSFFLTSRHGALILSHATVSSPHLTPLDFASCDDLHLTLRDGALFLPHAMTSTSPCATAPSSSLTRRRPLPPSRDGVLFLLHATASSSSLSATAHPPPAYGIFCMSATRPFLQRATSPAPSIIRTSHHLVYCAITHLKAVLRVDASFHPHPAYLVSTLRRASTSLLPSSYSYPHHRRRHISNACMHLLPRFAFSIDNIDKRFWCGV